MEKAPVNREWAQELNALHSILGGPAEQLPGDIRRNDQGNFEFVGGEMNEQLLVQRMAAAMKDRQISTYSELSESLHARSLMRSLQITNELKDERDESKRAILAWELVLANQAATYHEYLPEVVRQVEDLYANYQALRELGQKLHLPLPPDFDESERQAGQFLKLLRQALEQRVRFANAVSLRDQLKIQQGIPEFKRTIESLRALPQRTPDQDRDLKRAQFNLALAQELELGTVPPATLQAEYEKALQALEQTDRQVIQGGNEQAVAVRTNGLNQRIIDILSGSKEALGFKEDFVPQIAYIELWQQYDQDLLNLQRELERSVNREEPGKFAERQQYLQNIRSAMSGDMVAFTNDLGQYQMQLDELARVQNQVGHAMGFSGTTPALPNISPKEAEELGGWLEQRAQYRQQALKTALEEAEKMLQPGPLDRIEDAWTKQGELMVMDTAMRLSKIAAGWLPSEANGSGVLEKTYRWAAKLSGLPESREQTMEGLAGPMREVMGWPKDKTWSQMSAMEKQEVIKRAKSVADALKSFDKTKITNLQRTMAAIEEIHAKYPPSSFANEPVDQEVLAAYENQRVESDLTGRQAGGKTINRATAYILLLRQRRKDWGDPEAKTGFIGEYAKLLDALDENVKRHLDIAGALFKMQRAWFDYATDLVKLAGAGLLAPWVFWAIFGVATAVLPTAWKVTRYTGGKMYQGGRYMLGKGASLLRGLPEFSETTGATGEALKKMRYLARERQIVQWLEGTRAGKWLSRLKPVADNKVVRGGGRVLKYGAAALIPAIAAYESWNNRQRIKGAEGNEALQAEYRDNYSTIGLEAGGLAVTMPLSIGPQIVLAAPVIWAAEYDKARTEVRAGWARQPVNWAMEFDSSSLLTQLRQTTLTNAVEAGGGGALKPRIMFPSRQDQLDAADSIGRSQTVARKNIMEGYFMRNLLIPKDAGQEGVENMLRWKMEYMRAVTGGSYGETFSYFFAEADLYAELRLRMEQMEKSGEPLLMSYFGEDGERCWLDLSKLKPGPGTTDSEMARIVQQYRIFIRPAEETNLYAALGRIAREERGTKWAETEVATRRMIGQKLSHMMYKVDSRIAEVDWPGVNFLGMTSGNTYAQNVVRSYLGAKVKEKIDWLVPNLLEGNLKPEQYSEAIRECESILSSLITAVEDGKADQFYAKAAEFFGGDLSSARSPATNPLVDLIGLPPVQE